MAKRKMSLTDAADILGDCDDIPDGAYMAMLEEMGGSVDHTRLTTTTSAPPTEQVKCDKCPRKFGSRESMEQHSRMKHK